MTIRHVLVALLFGVPLLASAQGSSSSSTFKATVGPTTLTLPTPAGFVPIQPDAPFYSRLESSLGASGNRMVALMVLPKDAQAIADGKAPQMNRYVMVQTLRETEAMTLTPKDMTEAKTAIREQYKTMFAKLQPKVQQQLDYAAGKLSEGGGKQELSLMLGETRPLDIFDERPLSISFLTLSKITVGTSSSSKEVPLVSASTTMTVKGKLLYFLVYSVYEGQSDTLWTRKVTTDWLSTVK